MTRADRGLRPERGALPSRDSRTPRVRVRSACHSENGLGDHWRLLPEVEDRGAEPAGSADDRAYTVFLLRHMRGGAPPLAASAPTQPARGVAAAADQTLARILRGDVEFS
jgi:hypothetical protein